MYIISRLFLLLTATIAEWVVTERHSLPHKDLFSPLLHFRRACIRCYDECRHFASLVQWSFVRITGDIGARFLRRVHTAWLRAVIFAIELAAATLYKPGASPISLLRNTYRDEISFIERWLICYRHLSRLRFSRCKSDIIEEMEKECLLAIRDAMNKIITRLRWLFIAMTVSSRHEISASRYFVLTIQPWKVRYVGFAIATNVSRNVFQRAEHCRVIGVAFKGIWAMTISERSMAGLPLPMRPFLARRVKSRFKMHWATLQFLLL